MLHNQRVIVVLPAYRAAKTVERTYHDLPLDVVDQVLLVDDAGGDDTAEISRRLGIKTILHRQNLGYGANQKTCYFEALAAGADIVVMVHPDYQYDPRLVTAMAGMVASGVYDAVLGSRIGTARKGGMPIWKYVANRVLTAVENLLLGTKLTEFHSGYRAFSRKVMQAPAAARQFRRFCLRQPDDRPARGVQFHDRRDFLPDEIFQRSQLDQFSGAR